MPTRKPIRKTTGKTTSKTTSKAPTKPTPMRKPTDLVETRDLAINSPSHYKAEDGLEVIDVIECFVQDRFHLGNAVKYILRAGKKVDTSILVDPTKRDLDTAQLRAEIRDVEKATWYLLRYTEQLKEKLRRADNWDPR